MRFNVVTKRPESHTHTHTQTYIEEYFRVSSNLAALIYGRPAQRQWQFFQESFLDYYCIAVAALFVDDTHTHDKLCILFTGEHIMMSF